MVVPTPETQCGSPLKSMPSLSLFLWLGNNNLERLTCVFYKGLPL
jgi:hypothetical protein